MLTRDELRQEVHNLLAEAALTPTFGKEVSLPDLAFWLSHCFANTAERGFGNIWLDEVRQTERRFVLGLDALYTEEDPDEICAMLEAFIGIEGVTVEPCEPKGLSDFGKRTRHVEWIGSKAISPGSLVWAVPPGYRSPYTGKRTKLLPPAAHGPARKGKTGKPARW